MHRRDDVLRLQALPARTSPTASSPRRASCSHLDADRAARPAPPARHGDHRAATSILLDMSMMWDPELLAQGQDQRALLPRQARRRFGVLPRFGKGERDPLVRGLALLHVPHRQRLGGGRRDRPPRLQDRQSARGRSRATRRAARRRRPSASCGSSRALYRWTLDLATGAREGGAARRRAGRVPAHGQPRCSGGSSRYSYHPRLAPRADAALRRRHQVRPRRRARAGRTATRRAASAARRCSRRASGSQGRGRRVSAHLRRGRGDAARRELLRARRARPRRASRWRA